MGLLDAFRKDEVVGSKVLLCTLGTKFDDARKNDERIYKRYYPSTTSVTAVSVAEIQSALKQKPDILHLFCDVNTQGAMVDGSGARLAGAELLQAGIDAGVKWLWIASDNPGESYIAGFKAKGLKINLVMTLRRLGPNFSLFLDSLLGKVSSGETLPKAWVAVAPQKPNSVQPDVPETIFSAGRGGVILRP